MPVRRRARAPRPAAVSGACDGCDAEGDLGSVAALLEVLHPALDLFDMTPDARQLALDGARPARHRPCPTDPGVIGLPRAGFARTTADPHTPR